ncbi:MAG: nicotinamide-nucleotide amidohydrolase family protein [Burkholderiales bacterium]|nr:nicotinamide-nucleotide amidohydrolase family protein [Burkholderiales bacterium]
MPDDELHTLAAGVGRALLDRQLMLVTAESCTGGWISEAITSVVGSSQWFDRGFVCYSNRAKQEMLGVSEQTLRRYGAVSEPAVIAMATGALERSGAEVALAVSGIAGPGGALPDKPVGTVCFAWLMKGGAQASESRLLVGDRTAVRRHAVIIALRGVLRLI